MKETLSDRIRHEAAAHLAAIAVSNVWSWWDVRKEAE
jgi:hypothetical protein